MEEEIVQAENSNQQEGEALETSEESNDEVDYKSLFLKEKERAENQKIRAEKAEKLAKQKQSDTSKQVTPELDNATLARIYQIPEEDFEEVLDMAKFKKLSIAETLKLGATKAILAEKAEFRRTSEMSNTGNARRGASKVSDDVLLANLSKGEIPESKEEAERLFWAKRGGKRT
jgi:hypothetical protein